MIEIYLTMNLAFQVPLALSFYLWHQIPIEKSPYRTCSGIMRKKNN